MILLLNGGVLLEEDELRYLDKLKENIDSEEIVTINLNDEIDWDRTHRCLEEAKALVLVCNICMNSVPAHILRFLETVEQAVIQGESIPGKFYAILYTYLYEGEHTGVAMGVLKDFCKHANITWGRGLGIGGSGVILHKRSLLFGRKYINHIDRHLEEPIIQHAMFIKEHMQGKDDYISPVGVSKCGYMRLVNHEIRKKHA